MRKGKMKLTKQTLKRIIKEELEAETAESTNPIELEKQLEPMVAAYLGGANNDASDQMIQNFIAALMDLKSNGEQDLEEANSVNRTQADAAKMKAFLDVPEEERKAQYDRQQPKDKKETERAKKQRADLAAQEKGRKPLDTNMGPTDVRKNLKDYDKKYNSTSPWRRR